MSRICGILVLLATLTGCPAEEADKGKGKPDVEDPVDETTVELTAFERFCTQLDECNSLTGMSASECADYFVSCTDDLLASEAADVEAATSECLADHDECPSLEECYLFDVPYC